MVKDLDRPVEQYQWVLTSWLTTPGLTHDEATLIRAMQNGLNNSIAEFDQLRRIATQPAFLNTLRSAANKAVAAGLLIDWSEYAEQA